MDALAGLLDGPRARGAFLLRSILDPPWSLRIQDRAPLTLVAVVARRGVGRSRRRARPCGSAPATSRSSRGPDPYTVADDPATPPQVVIHPGAALHHPARGGRCPGDGAGRTHLGQQPGRLDDDAHRHLPAGRRDQPAPAAGAAHRCWSCAQDAWDCPLSRCSPRRSSRTSPARRRSSTGCSTCC